MALPFALGLAALMSIPVGLVFALRAGAATFPVLAIILWRGYGPRLLVPVAAVLLGVVVPFVYVVFPPPNLGGYNFNYSVSLIWAHWIGVGAILLLAMASWRMLAAERARRKQAAPPPTSDPADADLGPDAGERELTGAVR